MKVCFPCQLQVVLLTKSLAILCDSSFNGSKLYWITCVINLWLKNVTCVHDVLYRNVPKMSHEQKLNFLNWNLEIWVFFSRVMVNIVVIYWTNKHTNRKNKFLFVKFYDEFLWLVRPCVKWSLTGDWKQ